MLNDHMSIYYMATEHIPLSAYHVFDHISMSTTVCMFSEIRCDIMYTYMSNNHLSVDHMPNFICFKHLKINEKFPTTLSFTRPRSLVSKISCEISYPIPCCPVLSIMIYISVGGFERPIVSKG